MKDEYLKNARHYSEQIYEYAEQILTAQTQTIFLITGKECNYDILYNGSVILYREDEQKVIFKSVTDATIKLANIIETLYK